MLPSDPLAELAILAGAANARVCLAPDRLTAIAAPGVNLVVWRRAAPAELCRLLEPLPFEALPQFRLEQVPVATAAARLREAVGRRADALGPLIADLAGLVTLFARVSARPAVSVRLDRITGDACRRFHADHVEARRLCTYLGAGTEWLPDAAVRLDPDGHVTVPEASAIRRLEAFEVDLFKGGAWPGACPCVHRSPPIAGTGNVRLLACVGSGHCC